MIDLAIGPKVVHNDSGLEKRGKKLGWILGWILGWKLGWKLGFNDWNEEKIAYRNQKTNQTTSAKIFVSQYQSNWT